MKRQLKALVEARIKGGGKCPAGYERWWRDWEAHNWTPFAYHEMKTKMTPAVIHFTGTTTFKVHATDVYDGTGRYRRQRGDRWRQRLGRSGD